MPMWNATIDIAGLYAMDNTIFDSMVFPTSTVVDKDGVSHSLSLTDEVKTNIIDMILFKSEGRCVRYEDPDVFKNRLAILSKQMSRDKWERIMYYNFFTRTFDPTENVFEVTNEETKRQNGRTLTYKYSNYKETSEQKADGKNSTSFTNYVETDEQKSDGKNNTSFVNYVEADEQKTNGVHERHGANVKGDGGAGNGSVSVTVVQDNSDGYGSVNGSLPISESETINDKLTDSIGKIEHSKDGEIQIATGIGKIEHTKDGSIDIAISQGKIEKGISGEKSEVETFSANPDLFERTRHGNIGVTMSGEIIKNTFETEEGLDIESTIIDDVIDNLALAVF